MGEKEETYIKTAVRAFIMAVGLILVCSLPALAQYTAKNIQDSTLAMAIKIAKSCQDGWEPQQCLSAISESALVLAANYAGQLEAAEKPAGVEKIKEHCAAATAAMNDEFPAEVMKSAYTECANTIFDVSEETGIMPDESHYQLLVGPILCLDGDQRCYDLENRLQQYR